MRPWIPNTPLFGMLTEHWAHDCGGSLLLLCVEWLLTFEFLPQKVITKKQFEEDFKDEPWIKFIKKAKGAGKNSFSLLVLCGDRIDLK
jgi:hypothetical protein